MEAFRDRLERAIGDAIVAGEISGGGMPSYFYIIGQTIDGDGEKRCFTTANCGLVETLGLLHLARSVQHGTAVKWFEDDTEDA